MTHKQCKFAQIFSGMLLSVPILLTACNSLNGQHKMAIQEPRVVQVTDTDTVGNHSTMMNTDLESIDLLCMALKSINHPVKASDQAQKEVCIVNILKDKPTIIYALLSQILTGYEDTPLPLQDIPQQNQQKSETIALLLELMAKNDIYIQATGTLPLEASSTSSSKENEQKCNFCSYNEQSCILFRFFDDDYMNLLPKLLVRIKHLDSILNMLHQQFTGCASNLLSHAIKVQSVKGVGALCAIPNLDLTCSDSICNYATNENKLSTIDALMQAKQGGSDQKIKTMTGIITQAKESKLNISNHT